MFVDQKMLETLHLIANCYCSATFYLSATLHLKMLFLMVLDPCMLPALVNLLLAYYLMGDRTLWFHVAAEYYLVQSPISFMGNIHLNE